jgi:geranylgeranyl diphosphate synthase type II
MNNYISLVNEKIEQHLEKYFKKNDPMMEVCKYSLNNGKKIRPSISLDICKSLLNSTKNAEFPSLLVEYLHASSLIIDDLPCMDNADTRRNNPSTHVKYGESVTQLCSIVLVSLSMDALNFKLDSSEEESDEMMKISYQVFTKLSKILGNEGIAGGQLLDLALNKKDVKTMLDEKNKKVDLHDMIIKKTGALFELSFIIGWLFGKGDSKNVDDVRNASLYFSMIYQILDDLDDVVEDEASEVSKENSKNYVITHGKEQSIKDCLMYINKFRMEMVKLNIYSEYFADLMKYVKEKLIKYE